MNKSNSTSGIYAFGIPNSDYVKFGMSKNLAKRKRTHEKAHAPHGALRFWSERICTPGASEAALLELAVATLGADARLNGTLETFICGEDVAEHMLTKSVKHVVTPAMDPAVQERFFRQMFYAQYGAPLSMGFVAEAMTCGVAEKDARVYHRWCYLYDRDASLGDLFSIFPSNGLDGKDPDDWTPEEVMDYERATREMFSRMDQGLPCKSVITG
jgi:hypothetical protein